ncbi:MAG: DUF4251 domain-containing protein [Chitinophagaceae bacterium]
MKYLKINGFLLFSFLSGGTMLHAQDKKADAVNTMVSEKNFVFKAQTALPMGGRTVNLTSEYDVTIRPDSVISFLPYYGRAYSAPIDPTKGGIQFTSTDFGYESGKGKKGRWQITVKPRDAHDVQQLNLTVFENGSASLNVTDQNRQSITFQGYVVEGRPLIKKAF